MRDIGKITIDERILKKTQGLTKSEIEEMRNHSETGYRIAKSVPELNGIANYIFTHNEAWDGSGYPRELPGEDIPLFSRIIQVAEYYDKIISKSNKDYKKRYALEKIGNKSGTKFDPSIVDALIKVVENKKE